ncbi:thiolase family protein [Mycobacterium sp. AZCC_0083]|uniref:thiolase family protein n=1 Tax=Mycobacterium sp. AZCC_0083 TaxID=2735882 RepID=UPI0016231506|nr:thiolase family protein [Mycobacterium sp. AZCC_0083]MBB5164010.1 acetyl-CoA acetyltransferase [Mycobacterium sp. AZCC_0083]
MNRSNDVYVVGLGIHPFGRHDGVSALDMGTHAVRSALDDVGLTWKQIDLAVGGSNTAKPDALVARLGLTGLSFVSVRNGCATGGLALSTAANALRAGEGEFAVVVGFDKHERGAFTSDAASYGLGPWYPRSGLMVTTQYFAMRTRRYMHDYGVTNDSLAHVAVLSSRCGAANPIAWRRRELSTSEVLSAPMVSDPLTQLMFCQPNEGAVALVVARGERAFELSDRPVRVAAIAARSRGVESFEVYSPSMTPGRSGSPTVAAAAAALGGAGISARDVDIAQVQDTDTGSALISLAETGLCEDGAQTEMLNVGDLAPEGGLALNTDGGCLANGEPIGASGLRQVHEIVRQLQGRPLGLAAAPRPQIGFTHVYGAPGIAACSVLTTVDTTK